MKILAKIQEIDMKNKGVDNPSTSPAELMKELVFFIMHWNRSGEGLLKILSKSCLRSAKTLKNRPFPPKGKACFGSFWLIFSGPSSDSDFSKIQPKVSIFWLFPLIFGLFSSISRIWNAINFLWKSLYSSVFLPILALSKIAYFRLVLPSVQNIAKTPKISLKRSYEFSLHIW